MKGNNKSAHGQSGFTLVEVMIATIVLGIGMTALGYSFAHGMLILAATPMQLSAKEVAATVIDELTVRRDSGEQLPSAGSSTREVCFGQGQNIKCQDFGVETRVTNNADGINGLARVEVTIVYKVGNATRRYVKTINL